MKPERPLVAERPLAQHSAALLRPAPGTAELLPALARAGDRMARSLRNALAPLLGGSTAMVVCAQPVEQAASECTMPGLVVYSLYTAGASGHPVLSVVEGETVLALLDRAFGGAGAVPSVLPRELPVSAELMAARIEAIAAQQLAAVLATEVGELRPLRRATSLAELGGLTADTRVAMLEFTVREGARPPWALRMALPMTALADLIYGYGEERLSRRIARRIQEQGPWAGRTTAELAYLVAGCYPPAARRGRIHPATRTFQALRIAVNDELGVLDRLLAAAPDWLLPGGLFGVISFHSLEDRRVKTAFLRDERLERVTRKAVQASDDEVGANPRARSARWRVARRRG
jgi:hypothetical protein